MLVRMTRETLETEIRNAIPQLLKLARDIAYNTISDNCVFILSEIKNTSQNLYEQLKTRHNENNKKQPVALEDILKELQTIYDNLYDVNLTIYRAEKHFTVIDVRYFPKSSIDEEFRPKFCDTFPMLHCYIGNPPKHSENKKINVNWEHNRLAYKWNIFLLGVELKWITLKRKMKV